MSAREGHPGEVFEYAMPSLGADMDEGRVVEWNVSVGDEVRRGDVVARVETEKSDIDIEIWRGGVVEDVLVEVNRLVPVGTQLLRLRATDGVVRADEAPDELAPPGALDSPAPAPLLPPEPVVLPRADRVGPLDRSDDAPPSAEERSPRAEDAGTVTVWATPLARRLAGEHGIALTEVSGSGPGGAIRRHGADVTLVASAGMVPKTIAAAERLHARGVDAEVIDLRSLRPLDIDTLAQSVARTNHAVVVDEGWRTVGLSAELAAAIAERCFWSLDAPVRRLAAAEVPIPYARHLEDHAIPQVDDIADAAFELLETGR